MERITRHLEALVRAVQEHGPLRRADPAGIEELRGARPVQLERLLEEAVAAGAVTATGDRIEAVLVAAPAADEADGTRAPGPMRIVAIDFESVVRTTAAYPYVERRAFQVGALRFGRDRDWVFENRTVNRFCELPEVGDGPAWQITSPDVAARHDAEAVPAEVWLAELDAVLDGADVVVAYNGLELDFPLVDEERERAGLPPLSGVDLVDGLVLALSVWPNPPNNHRLARLAERLNVRVERYTWHDALSDCRLLATVVWAAARTVSRGWDPALADMVLTACHDSPTWAIVADLGRRPPSGHRPGDDEVAAILGDELDAAGIVPRRQSPSEDPSPPGPVTVPGELVGADGRVDPHRLAEVARGESLARRAAQGQMAELVGGWVAAEGGGLIEAPTGTGKSLVLLGAALDWARRSPGHRAIIATHTKQLQSQLAKDVQRLVDAGIGVLAGTTDLVKGASNLLSVRGLTVALADACRTERRRGAYDDPARRELLAYLAVRFVTAQTLSERWLARSVDGVDIPVVFSRTSRGLVGAWLAGVSQHDQGEYRPDADVPLTLHTDRVGEALEAHRIVIANHALLLAHRDDLAAVGDGLVVLVDEAHELEGAATDALSETFDYQALERIPHEVGRVLAEADPHDALRRAGEAAGQLRRFLGAGGMLRKALADACRKGTLLRNVADLADAPKPSAYTSKEMRTWTAEQLRQFLEEIDDHRLGPAFYLAANTGMRRGEVLGLRWDDVDLESARISVRHAVLNVAYELVLADVKTNTSRRTIDLDARTVAVLRAWRKAQLEERLALGRRRDDDGIVFAALEGGPTHPDLFSQTFDRHLAKSSLPRIRLHDLRHTHASILQF